MSPIANLKKKNRKHLLAVSITFIVRSFIKWLIKVVIVLAFSFFFLIIFYQLIINRGLVNTLRSKKTSLLINIWEPKAIASLTYMVEPAMLATKQLIQLQGNACRSKHSYLSPNNSITHSRLLCSAVSQISTN